MIQAGALVASPVKPPAKPGTACPQKGACPQKVRLKHPFSGTTEPFRVCFQPGHGPSFGNRSLIRTIFTPEYHLSFYVVVTARIPTAWLYVPQGPSILKRDGSGSKAGNVSGAGSVCTPVPLWLLPLRRKISWITGGGSGCPRTPWRNVMPVEAGQEKFQPAWRPVPPRHLPLITGPGYWGRPGKGEMRFGGNIMMPFFTGFMSSGDCVS